MRGLLDRGIWRTCYLRQSASTCRYLPIHPPSICRPHVRALTSILIDGNHLCGGDMYKPNRIPDYNYMF